MLPSLDSLPTISDLTDSHMQPRRVSVSWANVAGWKPPLGLNSVVVSVPPSSIYAPAHTHQHQQRYPSLDRVRVSSARTSAHPYARPPAFSVGSRSSNSLADPSLHGPYMGTRAFHTGFPSLAGPSTQSLVAAIPSLAHGGISFHPVPSPQSTTRIQATFTESGTCHSSSPIGGLASGLDDSASLYSYSSSSSNSPPPSSLATPGPELRLPPLGHEYGAAGFDQGGHGLRALQTGSKRVVPFWKDSELQVPPLDVKHVQV